MSEPSNPLPSPLVPNLDGHSTTDNPGQGVLQKSPDPVHIPSEHTVASPALEKPGSDLPSSSSAPTTDVDVRLAEQGDAFAQYRLGRYYARRDGRQTPESVSWYKKASPGLHRLANTGNGQAMYVLGVMYAYGRGVTRDTDQARHWLTRAIEQKVTAAKPVLSSLGGSQSIVPNRR
ncbi:MAG: tetratricopeptide repeat protein [Nitrospira sp.]